MKNATLVLFDLLVLKPLGIIGFLASIAYALLRHLATKNKTV